MRQGSYPGAFPLADDVFRWRAYMRDSILEPAIGRDILMLEPIRRPALLRQLFFLCLEYPACIMALHKLVGQLPYEVDGVFSGSWGKWAVEVKTGDFALRDLAGLLEFCRRNSEFRPLVLCSRKRASEGVEGIRTLYWGDFLVGQGTA